MRKYKSHELVDFKPRSLSSLKYDIDGMLPRSKSGHVVYCIFSRGSLLLITLHLPHLLGRGASQDTFLIKCLRFDCIRNFFEARSFKSFRQDVVYSQPGLRVRVATSDVWLVGWSKFENIYMSIHCTFFFPNLRVKTSPQVLDFGFSIQIDCIWVMAASLTFWHFLLRGRNWFKTRIRILVGTTTDAKLQDLKEVEHRSCVSTNLTTIARSKLWTTRYMYLSCLFRMSQKGYVL